MKYIKKNIEGISIIDDLICEKNTSLRSYLDIECLKNGSTYLGRIASAKFLHKRKGLVPLYVNRDCLFIFSKNIREWDVVLVNYHRILSFLESDDNQLLIVFDDLTTLLLNISFNRFKKQYSIAQSFDSVFH